MEKLAKKENIIQSKRKFGIEIEVGAKRSEDIDTVRHIHSGWLRAINDSSVQIKNGIEFVTSVLEGSKGAKRIINLCDTLNELNFVSDDVSCGMHVHLDAPEFKENDQTVVVDGEVQGFLDSKYKSVKKLLHIQNEAVRNLFNKKKITNGHKIEFVAQATRLPTRKGVGQIFHGNDYHKTIAVQSAVKHKGIEIPSYKIARMNEFDYEIEKIKRDKKVWELKTKEKGGDFNRPIIDVPLEMQGEGVVALHDKFRDDISDMMDMSDSSYVADLEDDRPLNRLKALMFFYVGFNPVIRGMVAPSRKKGNAYCMPISDFFDLDVVENLQNYSDFEKMWYKVEDESNLNHLKSNHYHDSRYLDVNLHSLWNRTGTIEIRIHGSSKDANQILLWTAFHQHIVDMIASGKVDYTLIKEHLNVEDDLESMYHSLVACFDPPEYLQNYVRKLLNHFSDLNIK